MIQTDLFAFKSTYVHKVSIFKRSCWYFANNIFFKSSLFHSYYLKSLILKCFGSKIGKNVVIKPSINIKYPWLLEIGDNTWIGEYVWIDNLAPVIIGANVCISQAAMLLTGNHNYTSSKFDLITKEIVIHEGVWIGAKSIVCPGVICKSHAVLTVGSVATSNLEPYSIYQGNPAKFIRNRRIAE